MYVQINDEGRITATSENDDLPGGFEFAFPDGFDFSEQYEYLIKDGELVESQSAERAQEIAQEEKLAAREEFLSTAPDVQAEQDDAICELYESVLAQQEASDDAICELYEAMIGGVS